MKGKIMLVMILVLLLIAGVVYAQQEPVRVMNAHSTWAVDPPGDGQLKGWFRIDIDTSECEDSPTAVAVIEHFPEWRVLEPEVTEGDECVDVDKIRLFSSITILAMRSRVFSLMPMQSDRYASWDEMLTYLYRERSFFFSDVCRREDLCWTFNMPLVRKNR